MTNRVILYRLIKFFISAVAAIIILQLLIPPIKTISAVTLQELSNEISQLTGDEENLVEEIVSTEALIKIKKDEIASLGERIGTMELELMDLNNERQKLKLSMDEKMEKLKERIVYSYKYSKNNVLKLIVSAGDLNEFFSNLYILRNIMRRDAELLDEIRLDKESYDRILRKSEEKKNELETVKTQKEDEQKKLEENLAKNDELLNQVKGQRQNVQKTLADIRARIAEIQPEGVVLAGEWQMVATAYYSGGGGLNGDGVTATGLRARKGIVAVDPRVIPLGTKVFIEGYGVALAADTGGWIKGNRIDLCLETLEECYRYGRRKIYVYLVD